MSFELVIKAGEGGVELALLQEKKLLELHREKLNNRYNVGDIYLGKVKKIVPGLNAAFVNVGYEKDAFLHYLDLGPQFSSQSKFTKKILKNEFQSSHLGSFKLEPEIVKEGKIAQVLSGSQQIMVQIAKEPISAKGPRLSTEITLAGRYLVLVPFINKVNVSQKIRVAEERDRLRKIILGIKPHNHGVIIRTVAEGHSVAELEQDLKDLMQKWDQCVKGLKGAKPPTRVLGEIDKASALLRDILNARFNAITVDDPSLFEEIKSYIQSISPGSEKIVRLHNSKTDVFEELGINKQIKALFGKQVPLPNGGYLIIEHTEAMHVIDVNSGNRKNSEKNQEENALEVNLEAATEIARIMRLRDMGGIVAVDFIDMSTKENNHKLFEHLKIEMKADRAKHTVLPPSKFGVVEVTRQRVRPVTNIDTSETCPVCAGSGSVEATILLQDDIKNHLRFIAEKGKHKRVLLTVHPYLEAFLTKGWWNPIRKQWGKELGLKIEVKGLTTHHILEYHVYNTKGEEINL